MAVYKRSGTWGEGVQVPAWWGTMDLLWAGRFLPTSQVSSLGTIFCDLTPTEDVKLDLTPSAIIQADLSPTADIIFEE